jgi:hypothetical protein
MRNEVVLVLLACTVTSYIVIVYWKAIVTFLVVACVALIFVGVFTLVAELNSLSAYHG